MFFFFNRKRKDYTNVFCIYLHPAYGVYLNFIQIHYHLIQYTNDYADYFENFCILFFFTQSPQSGSIDKKMKLFTSGSTSVKATIDKMGYMKGQLMSL